MYKFFIIILLGYLTFVSCTKDRNLDDLIQPVDSSSSQLNLKINEFIAAGSQNMCEFGTAEDWVEIYNPRTDDVTINAGVWYISDDVSNLQKYGLPGVSIPSHGFLLIWCDKRDTVATQIHTNFKLSSSGENLIISYKDSNQVMQVVDSLTFGAQQSSKSYGRMPDGSNSWTYFTTPTPCASNN